MILRAAGELLGSFILTVAGNSCVWREILRMARNTGVWREILADGEKYSRIAENTLA